MGTSATKPKGTDTALTQKMLQSLSKTTHFSFADLQELHHVFYAEYPDGFIARSAFIAENITAHGGPEQLWDRVFDFVVYEDDAQVATVLPTEKAPSPKIGDNLPYGEEEKEHSSGSSEMFNIGGQQELPETSPKSVEGVSRVKLNELSFPRMVQYLSQEKTLERRIKTLFRFCDLNGDSFLQEDELKVIFEWIYALSESHILRQRQEVAARLSLEEDEALDPEARARSLVLAMDIDGDGGLNENEFLEGCRADQGMAELLSFFFRR